MAELDPHLEARRFYAEASVGEGAGGAFQILLDGRRARTREGAPLALPTRALGALIAAEWAAQGPTVERGSMPATRLAEIAIDAGVRAREAQIETLERYGATDLVCYFAEHPRALVERQARVWGGLMAWAEETHGLALVRGHGIVHRAQPADSLARLADLARSADPFLLTGLSAAASLFGSAVIALALRAGRLDAGEAMAAALLDETFQQEQWGVDPEAAARATAIAAEAEVLERWFRALQDAPAP
jgi:chaperone required for assembly of F1-ATPase